MENMSKIKITKKREAGILDVLEGFDKFHIENIGRNIPLDIFMRYHFLKHKNEFNAEARTQMVENIYALSRYKGYLNAISSRK
jgi:hypothetical protein